MNKRLYHLFAFTGLLLSSLAQAAPDPRQAFMQPLPGLSPMQGLDFRVGQSIFDKLWVASPSSTTASDGLGPHYNARACARCHIRNGRGLPPEPGEPSQALFVKLSHQGQPDPVYGAQLQNFAVTGLKAEGQLQIRYSEVSVPLADGSLVKLQKPAYQAVELQHGPLAEGTALSPRIASPMIGLGLLEAIPQEQILQFADPDDKDGDGISGRANRITDLVNGQQALGRFGWKAGQPNLNQQNLTAMNRDMGLSNALFSNPYGDCTARQPDCLAKPHGNTPAQDNLEASRIMTDTLLLFTRLLAPPPARNQQDPQVQLGRTLFAQAGCQQCHRRGYTTKTNTLEPALSRQQVDPYTDLLLHDMGAELAAPAGEGLASGREWRTPPLWGIGLTAQIAGGQAYLHDGRARSLLEAILWHGGEAQTAQTAVTQMTSSQRNALIRFLESL